MNQSPAGLLSAESTQTTIPLPPYFPVSWENPSDASLLWVHERLHWPEPITPLFGSLLVDGGFARGTSTGLSAMGQPLEYRMRRINSYVYIALLPSHGAPDHLNSSGHSNQHDRTTSSGELTRLWTTEWLPEIQRHLAYWTDLDLSRASTPQLLDSLDETLSRFERLWDLHARVTAPAHFAVSSFQDLFQELFPSEDELEAYQLLQGFDNKILETDRMLWQLSRRVSADPRLKAVFTAYAPKEVLRQVEHTAGGHAFLTELHDYLATYGQRSEVVDVGVPSWIEDPTPVIARLKEYINQPDRNPEAEQTTRAADRERQTSEIRQRLATSPAPAVERFDFLLKAAQEATVLQEEHNFWIDAASTYHVRRVLLEFGRRFAETGAIEQPNDVFYLTLDELRQTAGRLGGSIVPDHRALAAGRLAELAYFRTVTPPPMLGTLPPAPAVAHDSASARMQQRYFGGPPQAKMEAGVLRGNPGSSGLVRGPARLVRSPAEAEILQPGDILVAKTTAPPWTPLFASVAGVVTDTGGVLSHGAIVAREYRIPAVVGCGTATALIRDGQMLEVDGSAGIVRIL